MLCLGRNFIMVYQICINLLMNFYFTTLTLLPGCNYCIMKKKSKNHDEASAVKSKHFIQRKVFNLHSQVWPIGWLQHSEESLCESRIVLHNVSPGNDVKMWLLSQVVQLWNLILHCQASSVISIISLHCILHRDTIHKVHLNIYHPPLWFTGEQRWFKVGRNVICTVGQQKFNLNELNNTIESLKWCLN